MVKTFNVKIGVVTKGGIVCKNPIVKLVGHPNVYINCIDSKKGIWEVQVPEELDLNRLDFLVDCNDKKLCDPCKAEIVTKYFCDDKGDCPDCADCTHGFCEELCAPEFCLNGECVECTKDSQCPCNQRCANGKCVCPQGQFLDADGICCIECDSEHPCGICEDCVGGKCVDRVCPDGICDPAQDSCVECVTNDQCGVNECCTANECNCCQGFVRNDCTGLCVPLPPNSCQTSNDCEVCENCTAYDPCTGYGVCTEAICPPGQVCYDGTCIDECDCDDPDCTPVTNYCGEVNEEDCGCLPCTGDCITGCNEECFCNPNTNQCEANPCVNTTCVNGVDCGEGCGCLNGTCVPCESLSCLTNDCALTLGCSCNGTKCEESDDCPPTPCSVHTDCGEGCTCYQGTCESCSNFNCQNTDCANQPGCACSGVECIGSEEECTDNLYIEKMDDDCSLKGVLEKENCCQCSKFTLNSKGSIINETSGAYTLSFKAEVRKGEFNGIDVNGVPLVDNLTNLNIAENEAPTSGRIRMEYRITYETYNGNLFLGKEVANWAGENLDFVANNTSATLTFGNIVVPKTGIEIFEDNLRKKVVRVEVTFKLINTLKTPNLCEYSVGSISSYEFNGDNDYSIFGNTPNFGGGRGAIFSSGKCRKPLFKWYKDNFLFRKIYVDGNLTYTDIVERPPVEFLESCSTYKLESDCTCDDPDVQTIVFCKPEIIDFELSNCNKNFKLTGFESCPPNDDKEFFISLDGFTIKFLGKNAPIGQTYTRPTCIKEIKHGLSCSAECTTIYTTDCFDVGNGFETECVNGGKQFILTVNDPNINYVVVNDVQIPNGGSITLTAGSHNVTVYPKKGCPQVVVVVSEGCCEEFDYQIQVTGETTAILTVFGVNNPTVQISGGVTVTSLGNNKYDLGNFTFGSTYTVTINSSVCGSISEPWIPEVCDFEVNLSQLNDLYETIVATATNSTCECLLGQWNIELLSVIDEGDRYRVNLKRSITGLDAAAITGKARWITTYLDELLIEQQHSSGNLLPNPVLTTGETSQQIVIFKPTVSSTLDETDCKNFTFFFQTLESENDCGDAVGSLIHGTNYFANYFKPVGPGGTARLYFCFENVSGLSGAVIDEVDLIYNSFDYYSLATTDLACSGFGFEIISSAFNNVAGQTLIFNTEIKLTSGCKYKGNITFVINPNGEDYTVSGTLTLISSKKNVKVTVSLNGNNIVNDPQFSHANLTLNGFTTNSLGNPGNTADFINVLEVEDTSAPFSGTINIGGSDYSIPQFTASGLTTGKVVIYSDVEGCAIIEGSSETIDNIKLKFFLEDLELEDECEYEDVTKTFNISSGGTYNPIGLLPLDLVPTDINARDIKFEWERKLLTEGSFSDIYEDFEEVSSTLPTSYYVQGADYKVTGSCIPCIDDDTLTYCNLPDVSLVTQSECAGEVKIRLTNGIPGEYVIEFNGEAPITVVIPTGQTQSGIITYNEVITTTGQIWPKTAQSVCAENFVVALTLCPSPSPTPTVTPSITPTITVTPSVSPTPGLSTSPTPTPSVTPSDASVLDACGCWGQFNEHGQDCSAIVSSGICAARTCCNWNSLTLTCSCTCSQCVTDPPFSPSPTPTTSATPSVTPTTGLSPSPTPSVTPTIPPTPSITPTNSVTPTVTPTRTPSITPTRTPSPSSSPLEATGRCCYTPLILADDAPCLNTTLSECNDLDGEWNGSVTCQSDPCACCDGQINQNGHDCTGFLNSGACLTQGPCCTWLGDILGCQCTGCDQCPGSSFPSPSPTPSSASLCCFGNTSSLGGDCGIWDANPSACGATPGCFHNSVNCVCTAEPCAEP